MAALLDKYERREKEVPIDYLGFRFLTGSWLAMAWFAERYRNLPYIAVVKIRNLECATLSALFEFRVYGIAA